MHITNKAASVRLFVVVVSALFSFPVFAGRDGSPSPSAEQPVPKDVQADITALKASIDEKELLSLSAVSLDRAWSERASKKMQDKMAYLSIISTMENVTNNFELCWKFARMTSFVGNYAAKDSASHRLSKKTLIAIFEHGMAASDQARKLEPQKVEGFYWYSVNLGGYGQTKGVLTALNRASEGRDSLLEAQKRDPSYWWGGPARVLGKYYQEVPSFISFGDSKKAEAYFQESLKLAPEYKLNSINYALFLISKDRRKEALELLDKAIKFPPLDGVIEEDIFKKEIERIRAEITK